MNLLSKQPKRALSQTRRHELALFSYRNALERGDFDRIASILQQAETDPVLDALLAELQTTMEYELPRPNTHSQGVSMFSSLSSITQRFQLPTAFPRSRASASVKTRNLTIFATLLMVVTVCTVIFKALPPNNTSLFAGQKSTPAPTTPQSTARQTISVVNVGNLGVIQEIPDVRLSQIAFSADGSRVAYETKTNLIQVRNIADEKVIFSFQANAIDSGDRAIALSPDGKYIVTPYEYSELAIWNTATGEKTIVKTSEGRAAIAAGKGYTSLLAFAPDSSRVYFIVCSHATSDDMTACNRFDVTSVSPTSADSPVYYQFASGDSTSNPALLPTLGEWVGGYSDGKLVLFDLKNGNTNKILTYSSTGITALAASMDGSKVATVDTDSKLQIWDTGSSKTLLASTALDKAFERRVLHFNADATLLASRGAPGDLTVQFMNASNGKTVSSLKIAESGILFALAFSPDGTLFATNGSDGVLRLWAVKSGS